MGREPANYGQFEEKNYQTDQEQLKAISAARDDFGDGSEQLRASLYSMGRYFLSHKESTLLLRRTRQRRDLLIPLGWGH